MHKPELIGAAAAAEELKIDRSTLSRWVTAGKITPVIRGTGKTGEKFFDRKDIEALVDESAKSAPKSVAS